MCAHFVGRVVSNRMQKTVVVAVDRVVWQHKLKMYQKRTSKHFAHDEEQSCDIGDVVKISWVRRMSKHKHYKVDNILKKVHVYTPELGQAAVDAAAAAQQQEAAAAVRAQEHNSDPPRIAAAQERYNAAMQRWMQLKQQYQQSLQPSSSSDSS